jgi:hypothetical protein
MNDAQKLTEHLRAMLRGREDRPEDKFLGDGMSPPVTVKQLLKTLDAQAAEIERLKPFEQAFSHAWKLDTRFDKKGQPRQVSIVLKSTVVTSPGMQRDVLSLLTDFVANSEPQP